jgi:hypothetical protein
MHGRWRRLTVIDADRINPVGWPYEHEPATANVSCIGPRHGERECGGHGGIHRRSSLLQDLASDSAGRRRIADDHPQIASFHANAWQGRHRLGRSRQSDGINHDEANRQEHATK